MKALLTLVVLLLVSIHVHLWLGAGRGREVEAATVASGVEERPILLEESTLRSLVRDEVARALETTALNPPDVEAIATGVNDAVRRGIEGAGIRETIAQEYVSGYYDAISEIERIETARAQSEQAYQSIRNNLRHLASAAQQFMLDEGVAEVYFDDIVGANRYISNLRSIAGEDYRSVFPVNTETTRLAVRVSDGSVVEYRF